MQAETLLSLFLIMLALAAVPSSSVLLVVSRATTHGLRHALLTTTGIVLADIVFILIAIYGLGFIENLNEILFDILRLTAASYLIWLGYRLIRTRDRSGRYDEKDTSGSGLLAGFLLTVGDQKAIIFYLGLFPVLFDTRSIGLLDLSGIILITASALFIAKMSYAVLALKLGRSYTQQFAARFHLIAAMILITISLLIFADMLGLSS